MALVSFKNIDIWPKMARMPIFGHTFFGHNSTIFGQIELKFFMGVQETIIYRLVMRNLRNDAYFLIFDFLGHFGRENGRVHHACPIGMGPPNLTKMLAHWVDLLGQPLS